MVRLFCVSDTHGHLPPIPAGVDLVLHAGDMVHEGDPSVLADFDAWLGGLPCLVVDGNHEQLDPFRQRNVPATDAERKAMRLDLRTRLPPSARELRDESVEWCERLRVAGLSWHGFPAQFDEWDSKQFADISAKCDVLLVHQPPGHLPSESASLLRLIEATQPLAVVCGHLHQCRGVGRVGNTVVVNCAVQAGFKPSAKGTRGGIVIELDAAARTCTVTAE